MTWNIAPECTALLFLAALIAYSKSRMTANNHLDSMFRTAEWTTLAAIALNICSTLMLYSYDTIPLWLTYSVTTAYFIFTPILPLIYFYYAVAVVHYGNSQNKLRTRWKLFAIPYICYLALLVSNIWNHTVFSIDPLRGYVQGKFIYSTYIVFYLYCLFICLLALQAGKRVGRRVMTVIMAFPIFSLAFIIAQKLFQDVILTGTASVFSLLVLFLYFQNNRLARDGLTGLYNREALLDTVQRRVKRAEHFELIAISLDNFKSINLRFGANTGDEFLRSVGGFLRTIKSKNVAYRYSGDTFAVITNPGEAEECMETVHARFAEPFMINGNDCRLSVSMALVAYPEADSVEEPISALDYALTELKAAVGGKTVRYEEALISRKKRRRIIAEQMHEALENDGFYLCYQPVWSLSRRKFISAEALLRMRETPAGPVYPDEFIPIAVQTGLIVPITYIVLEKACKMCAAFRDRLETVSVNFP